MDKAGASSIKAAFSSVPLKPKKERPLHPDGTSAGHSSQFLTTLQFCNSFSEPLEIEAVSTQDFDRALGNFPDDVLSQMHMVSVMLRVVYPDLAGFVWPPGWSFALVRLYGGMPSAC